MKTTEQNRKSKKSLVIIALVVALLVMGIGYAAFSETLTISGTANGTATWDVKFSDATSSTGATTSVDGSGKSVTVQSNLEYPGDADEVTVTISNGSSMPIVLTKFDVKGPDGGDADDIELVTGSELSTKVNSDNPLSGTEIIGSNGKCKYTFGIKWKKDSKKQSVNGAYTITFEYQQCTEDINVESRHEDEEHNSEP